MQLHFIDAARHTSEGLLKAIAQRNKASILIFGLDQKTTTFLLSVNDGINENIEVVTSSKSVLESDVVYLLSVSFQFQYDGASLMIKGDAGYNDDLSNERKVERLETLLEYYPNGSISLFDQNLYFLVTAGSEYQAYGMDSKSFTGKHVSEIIDEKVYKSLLEAVESIDSINQTKEYEVSYGTTYYRNTLKRIESTNGDHFYILRSIDETSARKKSIELKESEARFKYFESITREVICTHNADASYKYVSPSAQRILGRDHNFMIGKSPFDFIHPEDVELVQEYSYLKMVKGEQPKNVQFRFLDSNDEYKWLEAYAEIVTGESGEMVSFTTASRDITELKEAEFKLKESEARFKGIANHIPGVVYLCKNDPSYSMIFLNNEVLNITGYSAEEFLNGHVSFVDLYHPDDKEKIFKTVDNALEHKETFHLTYRMQKKGSQQWIWVDEYGQGIFEDKTLTHIQGVIVDISEVKNSERKIQESEANLKALFESTNSLVGLFDKEQRLVEYNHAFQSATKQIEGVDLFKGIDLFSIVKNKNMPILKALQLRALTGEKVRETLEYPSSTGTRSFLFNYNPIYHNEEIIGVSMFVEDITELKKSQKALEHYAENLEALVEERTKELRSKNEELRMGNYKLQEALGELKAAQGKLIQSEKMASVGVLSAGIGHEINNPLNFIKNGVSGLKEEIFQSEKFNNELFHTYFRIIEDGVARVARIVKSIGHFSRQMDSVEEKCDIHAILDNCLIILNSKLKQRIEVEKNYFELDISVIANEGRLHQAFLNLLSNAEQAIGEQGKIVISTLKEKNTIIVEIEDTGVGIAKENLSKIGDPFFTTKEPGVGTGLGMFITYDIIKGFNGELELESEPNKGTKIRVLLNES